MNQYYWRGSDGIWHCGEERPGAWTVYQMDQVIRLDDDGYAFYVKNRHGMLGRINPKDLAWIALQALPENG